MAKREATNKVEKTPTATAEEPKVILTDGAPEADSDEEGSDEDSSEDETQEGTSPTVTTPTVTENSSPISNPSPNVAAAPEETPNVVLTQSKQRTVLVTPKASFTSHIGGTDYEFVENKSVRIPEEHAAILGGTGKVIVSY